MPTKKHYQSVSKWCLLMLNQIRSSLLAKGCFNPKASRWHSTVAHFDSGHNTCNKTLAIAPLRAFQSNQKFCMASLQRLTSQFRIPTNTNGMHLDGLMKASITTYISNPTASVSGVHHVVSFWFLDSASITDIAGGAINIHHGATLCCLHEHIKQSNLGAHQNASRWKSLV